MRDTPDSGLPQSKVASVGYPNREGRASACGACEIQNSRVVFALRLSRAAFGPTRNRACHQDFLTLWKDADSELPVLIAAKAEYAKLQ